jgi:hypothetical protein
MRGSIMTSEDMMPSIDRLCEAVTTTILQKKKKLNRGRQIYFRLPSSAMRNSDRELSMAESRKQRTSIKLQEFDKLDI